VLGILFSFFAGVFWLGRGTYRLIRGWLNRPHLLKTVVAQEIQGGDGIRAEAILLRQEVVVLADKPGKANLLLGDGEQVEQGRLALEVVDKALLASIDAELQKIEQGSSSNSGANSQELANVETKLIESRNQLYSAGAVYREALRTQAVASYNNLYNTFAKSARSVVQLQQDYLRLVQSQGAAAERRQELTERRQAAIVPVRAPVAGTIFYWVDGLEQQAVVNNLKPQLWDQLQAAKNNKCYQTSPDSQIEAGQPVFKIAVGKEAYLLLQLAGDVAELPADWDSLSVHVLGEAGTTFSASVVSRSELGPGQVLLQTSLPETLSLSRFFEVDLHKEGTVFCRIPAQAIISIEDETVVFVLDGNTVKAHAIEVLRPDKKYMIVTGIEPGVNLIVNPDGLVDGQDVTDRLRK